MYREVIEHVYVEYILMINYSKGFIDLIKDISTTELLSLSAM